MKRIIILAAALLAFGIGNAQIANGRIGHGNISIAGTDWTDVYGIDFNNDGTLEFRISDFEGPASTWVNAYFSYEWTEGGNNIYSDLEVWDYIAILASGYVIDAHGNFAGYGDATFEELSSVPEHLFVGFRILLPDGVHYGWAEATVSTSAASNDIVLNWIACAYNTVPGGAIAAGQTGNSGIAGIVTPLFRALPLGEKSLRIEASDSDVALYDLNGRLLNTVEANSSATLALPHTGVYLLRSKETTRKVLVY